MRTIFISLRMLLVLTILTGIVYPLVVTVIGQSIFSYQANGSILEVNGRKIGSELIGQQFSDPKYFWSRPSATSPGAYNAASSGGSNLGPSNPALVTAIKDRIEVIKNTGVKNKDKIPVDIVTTSGSGLDPHITPASAFLQIPRIAGVRGIEERKILMLLEKFVEGRTVGVLGEKRVNVLLLNIALDNMS